MNNYYAVQAFKITIPVLFGYLAIGIPFGLMLVNAGYPWWLAPVMSVLMYAGAGQYMAVGLFASGASLSVIAIAMLFLNIRHIVYGLSLITPFKDTGKWKPYLIFALTDETYALMTGCSVPKGAEPGPFYGFIALLDHSYWILGSCIGALAGTLIPFSFEGVDFALTALFAVLLIDQLRKTRDVVPPLVGAAATVFAILFVPARHILVTALAAGVTVLAVVGKTRKNAGKEEPCR
ncbi:AzlC family ABC transporter permease [Treponema brennaborense]|uniref:AzlC family protein n=1 Tax=Treponema brennaborense (strain DSM 12168 / CIP 105900 / DD5/3) TaxID=906968 RepID=F4LPV1_TREBD|nr:AzlC family ABC transporter permease [Treponema brennaborense]AEE16043.1 AzlC family protein [Treponema brennaborense DSM 12168]